jgi:predicted acetyltransferase
MDFDVRPITEAEVPAWCTAMNTGFLNPAGAIDADARRPGLILDRTWGGFDGDRIVSTLRSFPTDMTVPGGRTVPVSALTAVTTTATHRRRGLAAQMVTADLEASKERGETASILIAAEYGIYGRFGYGPATEHQNWTVDTIGARLRKVPRGSVEFADRDTARAAAPAVFDRHRLRRPGEILRTDRFWDIDFGILRFPSWPVSKPGFDVLARDPAGEVIGVARYTYEERWERRLPQGTVNVSMFLASEPAGEALLWHHLIGLDMVSTLNVENRPTDDLLPWLLADPRLAQPAARADFLWIRPLDVATLLAARPYSVPVRLVIEVIDAAGLADGVFALDAGPDGATCVPGASSAAADLTLDVATLGSVYLGGHRVRALADADLVLEHTAGAVERADLAFRSPVPPWCSTWF